MLFITLGVLALGMYFLTKLDRERSLASLEVKVRSLGESLAKNSNHYAKQVKIFTSMLSMPAASKMEKYLLQLMQEHDEIQAFAVAYDPEFLRDVSVGKHPGFHVEDYFSQYDPEVFRDKCAFVYYRDAERNVAVDIDSLHSYETKDWFLLPRYLSEGQWTNPFVTRITGRLVCAYGLRFYHEGKPAGIVSCFVPFEELMSSGTREAKNSGLLEKGRFLITASNGCFLYDSDKPVKPCFSLYSAVEEAGREDLYPLCDRIVDEDFGIIELTQFNFLSQGGKKDNTSLWLCFLSIEKYTDWTLVAAVTDRALQSSLHKRLRSFCAITLIVVLFCGGIVATLLIHTSEPLFAMMALAQRAATGDYKGRVPARYTEKKNNIGIFANTFNNMLLSMENHIDNAIRESVLQTRMEQEVDIAHELQASFLPTNEFHYNPELGYAIQGKLISSAEIGGDFYDVWQLNDETVAFLVADVAGKGIAAAMCMVAARTIIRQVSERCETPGEVFDQVNDELLLVKRSGMFITAFLGFYNAKENTLLYCNAGHEPPFIYDGQGHLQEMGYSRNSILGSLHDERYVTETLQMTPSSFLLLYSNGIQNAVSPAGEQYGKRRFVDLLDELKNTTTDRIIPSIVRSLESFTETTSVDDDITLLVLKRTLPLPADTTNGWQCDETIVSDYGNGDFIVDNLLQKMGERGWSDRDSFAVNMAIVEGINNAIEHGNALDSTKKVNIKCEVTGNYVSIWIRDEGPGFREDLIPDPRQRRRLSCPTGRGVLLIRNFMSRVTFNEAGNEIQMEKYRSEII